MPLFTLISSNFGTKCLIKVKQKVNERYKIPIVFVGYKFLKIQNTYILSLFELDGALNHITRTLMLLRCNYAEIINCEEITHPSGPYVYGSYSYFTSKHGVEDFNFLWLRQCSNLGPPSIKMAAPLLCSR